MAILLAVLLALTSAVSYGQDDQKNDIPPLNSDVIIELILFEYHGHNKEDFNIIEIRQLDERARATLLHAGRELPLELVCKKTDFGPKWRISNVEGVKHLLSGNSKPAETLINEKSPSVEAESPGQDQKSQDNPDHPVTRKIGITPVKTHPGYQEFLSGFITCLKEEGEQNFKDYYFRDEDFDLENAEAESNAPREALKLQREEFIKACSNLSERINKYETFTVQSYFASSSSRLERKRLREIMPGVKRFKSSVSIEVLANGELGKLTIEGMVLLGDGWRIGKIAAVELP